MNLTTDTIPKMISTLQRVNDAINPEGLVEMSISTNCNLMRSTLKLHYENAAQARTMVRAIGQEGIPTVEAKKTVYGHDGKMNLHCTLTTDIPGFLPITVLWIEDLPELP